jgi:hypothetical protein
MPDSSRAAVRDVAAVLGCLVVLGALCGALWSAVVTPAELTRLPNGGAMNETALSAQFGADGWYAVIAVVAGLLAGIVLTWWRSRDALWTAALLVLGAVVAAVVMAVTGHLLGPPDPRHALLATKVGSKVPESLTLGERSLSPFGPYLKQTVMFYLAWPVGALAGCLAVLLVTVPTGQPPAEQGETPEQPDRPAPAEQGVEQSPAPRGTAD